MTGTSAVPLARVRRGGSRRVTLSAPLTSRWTLPKSSLDDAVEGADPAHPDARAVYVMHRGAFYKGYCEGMEPQDGGEGEIEVWHGYPVRRKLVPRQVPSRVLREFVRRGRLSRPEYKKLLGSAR